MSNFMMWLIMFAVVFVAVLNFNSAKLLAMHLMARVRARRTETARKVFFNEHKGLTILYTIPNLPYGAEQVTVRGKRCIPLFNSMQILHISTDRTEKWILGMYFRENPAGRYEVGLFCASSAKNLDPEAIPDEILRIFSWDPNTCSRVAFRHYDALMNKYGMTPTC